MRPIVVDAFEAVRDGFSVDRVIADPNLNERFVSECVRRAVVAAPVELNLLLLNLRKRAQIQRGSRRTIIGGQDAFGFAAEMAIRALERKHSTTLDRVLCDPQVATEFDSVAGAISPGYSSLEYRWAALGLRKAKRLRPEMLGRVVASKVHGPIIVTGLDPLQIPTEQGLYILTNRGKVLYVGEAQNLRSRLKKHFDHSDNKYLAQYIWETGTDDVLLEYHVLPESTSTRVRKAMELELIRSRRAEFNVQR
jgi:hypothetical protein